MAAELVAEDEKSDGKIAKVVGIAKRTLERWKRHPEFIAKVNEMSSRSGVECSKTST